MNITFRFFGLQIYDFSMIEKKNRPFFQQKCTFIFLLVPNNDPVSTKTIRHKTVSPSKTGKKSYKFWIIKKISYVCTYYFFTL
ncbi:MAG TPA: hypothetical protein DEQ30_15645 [Porphyromonadaceae bacterium]|nr:hypothetical protein [Porphyromonadaceae bacterium]